MNNTKDMMTDSIVDAVYDAGYREAMKQVCREEGHKASTNDQSEGGQVDVKCSRCGKRLDI